MNAHQDDSFQDDKDLHIASLVVMSHPDHLQQVQDTIHSIPGAEIPNATPEGKMVVVLEADDQAQLLDKIDHIQMADHILSASLVYHHIA